MKSVTTSALFINQKTCQPKFLPAICGPETNLFQLFSPHPQTLLLWPLLYLIDSLVCVKFTLLGKSIFHIFSLLFPVKLPYLSLIVKSDAETPKIQVMRQSTLKWLQSQHTGHLATNPYWSLM